MAPTANLAVLIPALDCAETIAAVVRGAKQHAASVVVVNDGSTDATEDRAVAAGAEVVSHRVNRGKGAALRTGLQALAQRGFDRVITMDGDGQHLPDQLPLLVAESDLEPAAIVLGQRRIEPGAVDATRLYGNRFANRWVEIACGLQIPDTQSGLRIYPLRRTLALGVRAHHFAFETEVLIRAARAGVSIRSVPVRAHYPPAETRTSHYQPFLDTVRIIFVVLGLIFRVW